jgi:hypothetical protein
VAQDAKISLVRFGMSLKFIKVNCFRDHNDLVSLRRVFSREFPSFRLAYQDDLIDFIPVHFIEPGIYIVSMQADHDPTTLWQSCGQSKQLAAPLKEDGIVVFNKFLKISLQHIPVHTVVKNRQIKMPALEKAGLMGLNHLLVDFVKEVPDIFIDDPEFHPHASLSGSFLLLAINEKAPVVFRIRSFIFTLFPWLLNTLARHHKRWRTCRG